MLEHLWLEETCSWVVSPPDRLPGAGDLRDGELLFVWGFLMDPRFLAGIVGHPLPFSPACLRGWRRESTLESGQRGFRLISDPAGVVMGVALVAPTSDEVAALDRFEGVPEKMVRRRVEILLGDRVRPASIYMAAGTP